MGFIFSTDNSYTDYIAQRRRAKKKQLCPYFASFKTSRGKATAQLSLSLETAREIRLGKSCIVGYDKDANEMVIVPSVVGNISVCKAITGDRAIMALRRFFNSQGVTEFPVGRFEVGFDEEGNCHIYLDKPLPPANYTNRVKSSEK